MLLYETFDFFLQFFVKNNNLSNVKTLKFFNFFQKKIVLKI